MGFFSIQNVSFYTASTFIDFQVERNILRDEVVFPLNKSFEDELIHIKNIDLRWGILPSDSEEKHEEKVLKVCTDQIKRTNSNVILFIGDRYGWVPAEEKMAPYLEGLDLPALGQISITALEILYALNHQSEDSNIFIYIRNITNYDELDKETKILFKEDHQDLEILKAYLIENYPELIRSYDVIWNESDSRIVKPENFKQLLKKDLESTIRKYQTKVNETDIVSKHLKKILHHHVERKYIKKAIIDKLSDPSKRGVLINNLKSDGTSVLIASTVDALRKKNKSVFYFSEDMKLDRTANIAELLQKPSKIRKPRNFQQAEKYFLDYMYLVSLQNPFETSLFLKLNHTHNKVVVLLRQALKEYLITNKQNHFICVDGNTDFLSFLVSIWNTFFLTSREMEIPQFIIYTQPFNKYEAKTLLNNLATDSSKEISDKLIENLLSKETVSKVRIFKDASVFNDYLTNGMPHQDSRPSFEEPEWIKQAFRLLEAQSDYEKIEKYSEEIKGNIEDLRANLIGILSDNLGDTYTKFALSYIGFLNSKASPDFIQSLLAFTLKDKATSLKFVQLQSLLKDFCVFDESRVQFQEHKADKLFFNYMREEKMHFVCLPYMLSFYQSQNSADFSAKDWTYFEEKLAFLIVEGFSLDLEPENQVEYAQIYKEILEKHTGLTEENLFGFKHLVKSLENKWSELDYMKMREYLQVPSHMKESVDSFYINWASGFHTDGKVLLNAFQAYMFINNTTHTDGKHFALKKSGTDKPMKDYEFFQNLLAYCFVIRQFID